MKKAYYFLFLILGILPFFCVAQDLSFKGFSNCKHPDELSGTYVNRDNHLSQLFGIKSELVYFIHLDFSEENTLRLTYETDEGLKNISFEGKFKGDFFEIYFSKKLIPIPLFFIKDTERIRIGCDEKSDLLIQYYQDSMGWVLFLAGGSTREDATSFQNIRNFKGLKPVFVNNLLGFTNNVGDFVVQPQYDFVEFFNHSVSRVKKKDKWGLINEEGVVLTPLKYDTIYPFGVNKIAEIRQYDKAGYLALNGEEILPPVYDEVYGGEQLIRVIRNGKVGYFNLSGKEIIPAIYDEAYLGANNYIKIILNGKEGYMNINGNETIPPIYDYIADLENASFVLYCQNGKYGYRSVEKIICPPVFEEASLDFSANLKDVCEYSKNNQTPYAKIKYKGEKYLLDKQGYLYRYECNKIRRRFTVFEESGIKVNDLIEDE